MRNSTVLKIDTGGDLWTLSKKRVLDIDDLVFQENFDTRKKGHKSKRQKKKIVEIEDCAINEDFSMCVRKDSCNQWNTCVKNPLNQHDFTHEQEKVGYSKRFH